MNLEYVNPFCTERCTSNMERGVLQCHCGEDDTVEWSWTEISTNARLLNNGKDVLFHPFISSGTAAARGNVQLLPNLHYYWELKMLTNLYGTDVLVGVGTADVILNNWKYTMCSMLGVDSHSWGYSYQGVVQHNGQKKQYGSEYGLGSIIGVHLNMCNGTLQYYINRKPLGIAFSGLKKYNLSPLVCSTAAQSAMRISKTAVEQQTLQMLCLQVICENTTLYKLYREIPVLSTFYGKKYCWIVPVHEGEERKGNSSTEDKLVINIKYQNNSCCILHRTPQRLRFYEE